MFIGAESMSKLEADLPLLASIVRARAPENKAILEALEDYELARAKEKDGTMRLDEKAEWSRIRKEVAAELERLISRQSKSGGNT